MYSKLANLEVRSNPPAQTREAIEVELEKYPLFDLSLPTLQVAWDSTSLGTLKECPRKYYYLYILQRSPRGRSQHLDFGSAFHKAVEIYDAARAKGLGHEAALEETVAYTFSLTDLDLFGDTYKNRFTLTRTVIWYFDRYIDEPLETYILADGTPANELSFKMDFPGDVLLPDGRPYTICGHLDKLVTYAGGVYGLDHKTTKNALDRKFFSQFSPSNQFDTYYFAGSTILSTPLRGFIINGIQVQVETSSFHRETVMRTPGQMSEWIDDTTTWLDLNAQWAERGKWPMNTKSCSNYGGCAFIDICSKDPSVRQRFLNGPAFEDRLFNPLVPR